MVRQMFRVVVWVGVALALAVPAMAQSAPTVSPRLGARVFGVFEWQTVTASKTFDAVTGTSTVSGFGGGAEVQRVWRGAFLRGSVTRLNTTGERIFVFDNQVYPLGVPLELSLTPVEVSAGWRFKPFAARGIVPYVGAGALFLKYSETASGDDASDKVSESYRGFSVFGGLEVPVWRRVSAGAELGWRSATVPDPRGALESFGENNLGGVTMRVMLSIRK